MNYIPKKRLNYNHKKTIKSIDISYLFAKELDHGVTRDNRMWELFEPTKFVYSFFSFNMLYEIDWDESINRGFSWDYRGKRDLYTSNKIIYLLQFIYKNSNEKIFKKYYSKYDENFQIILNSNNIVEDYNIKKSDKTDFLEEEKSYLENYKDAIKKLDEGDFGIKDHYKLIIFTYQIRNNIFHGLKKATEMKKSGQRERLKDYSYVIMATIEMFLDIMKDKYGYILAKNEELKENVSNTY